MIGDIIPLPLRVFVTYMEIPFPLPVCNKRSDKRTFNLVKMNSNDQTRVKENLFVYGFR